MSVEQKGIFRQSRKCTVFLQALHDKSVNLLLSKGGALFVGIPKWLFYRGPTREDGNVFLPKFISVSLGV